jgi:hypothetical protein
MRDSNRHQCYPFGPLAIFMIAAADLWPATGVEPHKYKETRRHLVCCRLLAQRQIRVTIETDRSAHTPQV